MVYQKRGNIFEGGHDCIINTINVCGAMGAGVALEFKNRFPFMFEQYQELCRQVLLAPGDAWFYEDVSGILIANLAVKNHFRNRARFSWAKMAVRNFVNSLVDKRYTPKSVGIPRIGSKNGGRGVAIGTCNPIDNWPADSEEGYKRFEPFLLLELERCPQIDFTIYEF